MTPPPFSGPQLSYSRAQAPIMFGVPCRLPPVEGGAVVYPVSGSPLAPAPPQPPCLSHQINKCCFFLADGAPVCPPLSLGPAVPAAFISSMEQCCLLSLVPTPTQATWISCSTDRPARVGSSKHPGGLLAWLHPTLIPPACPSQLEFHISFV